MNWFQRQRIALSMAADLPLRVAADLPQIALDGFEQVSIDRQEGLLSYSPTQIDVAVSQGCVSVCGSGLHIRLMKEGRIVLSGSVTELRLVREDRP